MFKLVSILFFTLFFSNAFGLAPVFTDKQLLSPPPRIIRTCCSFGSDVGVFGMPFLKYTDVSSIEKLGNHKYLGQEEENNGIIYTLRGGFIDMGHLRDQADWTAYLYNYLKSRNNDLLLKLGHEGGNKLLEVCPPDNITDKDLAFLSGNIAYDLSIWHEIATFYGTSYIPLIPERYSAFSLEDAYSNMLGVKIGIEAIQSSLPYEEAVTQLINDTLLELGAVDSAEKTILAMEKVRGIWWTREAKLPSKDILIEREFDVRNELTPWLVEDMTDQIVYPSILSLNDLSSNNIPLEQFYELYIKLNYKFPVKKLFNKDSGRLITQKDFDILIAEAMRKSEEDKIKEIR